MDYKNKNIHLVDLSYYLHRSYHIFKDLSVTINGFTKPTGHIKGCLDYIKKIKDNNKDAIIFLCLDDLPVKKILLLENIGVIYKDGRAKNEYNIKQDIDLICNLAYHTPGVYTAFCEGEEADDVISTLAYKYKKDNFVYIHSGDKDLVQLLDNRCYIVTEWSLNSPIKTTLDTYQTSEKYNKAFLNCNPKKLTFYRCIVGDASDNMKGLYRFPRKLAKLIAENTRNIEDYKCAVDKYSRFATKTQIKYLELLQESFETVNTYYDVMKLKTDLSLEIDRVLVPIKKDILQLQLKTYEKFLKDSNISII